MLAVLPPQVQPPVSVSLLPTAVSLLSLPLSPVLLGLSTVTRLAARQVALFLVTMEEEELAIIGRLPIGAMQTPSAGA